jgi:hypothetical protein
MFLLFRKHQKVISIFLAGILLRLLIMPFTGHWDLTSLHQVAQSLYSGGTNAAYQYYYAIYPPLAYIFLGFWQKIINPFLFSDFLSFLNNEVFVSFSSSHALRYFFLLKIPYMFFDIGIGILLYSMMNEQEKKDKIFLLWFFNPITLYATFAWGTLDIIPTFFIVLSLFLVNKNHNMISAVMLGIGASFKAFPLLLLLPLCLISMSGVGKKKIFAIIFGLAPFLLILFPFLKNSNFVASFFSSEQIQIIQHAGFYIGRGENLSLYYIFYALLILFLSNYKIKKEHLSWFFFLVLFVFYAFSAFTPQWFVWGLPFFFMVCVHSNLSNKWLVFITILYFSIVLLFEVTLNFGLFAPLDISLLDYPSIGDKVSSFINTNRLMGIIRSCLSGIILWLVYITKPKRFYEDI